MRLSQHRHYTLFTMQQQYNVASIAVRKIQISVHGCRRYLQCVHAHNIQAAVDSYKLLASTGEDCRENAAVDNGLYSGLVSQKSGVLLLWNQSRMGRSILLSTQAHLCLGFITLTTTRGKSFSRFSLAMNRR